MVLPERLGSLGALLRDIAADQRIVDEMVEAARTSSTEVARLPWAENRRHVAALLAAGLASFELLADPTERDFAEVRRLGAARAAQGVSVTGLLRGVQAGRRVVVETALDRGRAAGIPDSALLEGLLDLDRYAGALERALVDGYHAAERELARTEQDARNRMLRRLLSAAPSAGCPDDLARFGLRPDGRYHCVVTDLTEPTRVRTAERRLTRCGGLFGTVDDRLAGLCPRPLPADALDAATLVVTAPTRPLDRLPAMHALCVAALHVAADAGLTGRYRLADLAGEVALAAQPALADVLSTTLLAASTRPTGSTGNSPRPRCPTWTTGSGWTTRRRPCTCTPTRSGTGCVACGTWSGCPRPRPSRTAGGRCWSPSSGGGHCEPGWPTRKPSGSQPHRTRGRSLPGSRARGGLRRRSVPCHPGVSGRSRPVTSC